MKRYITINNIDEMEMVEDKLPVTPSSPYVVDDSCFIPMSEAVRQLEVSSSSDNTVENYDFPDGKDDGRSIPISRRKNVKDIAEVSSEIMSDINNLSEKISKNQKKAAEIAAFESELKSAGSSSSESTKQ